MTTSISLTINWDGKPVSHQLLKQINQCVNYHCPDGNLIWQDANVGMTQANLITLPEDNLEQIIGTENLKIVASCRLDNRDELISLLKPQCQLLNNSDTEIILAGYQVYGETIVERLIGDFAFIIWDQIQQKIISAKDFCGLRRLFYYADENKLIIASERTQIFQDPDLKLTPNEDDILKYLTPSFQYYSGWDLGWFQGINSVKAGHILTVQNKQIKEQKFWNFPDTPLAKKSESQWIEEYLFILKQAVECRLRANYPVGIELSGGLDSSAVAVLASNMGKEINTFSLTFPNVSQVDERSKIQDVLAQYPSLKPHFFNAEKFNLPLFLQEDWQPQGLVSPYEMLCDPLYHLNQYAQELGIKIILSGMMGDALNYGCDRVFYDLLIQGKYQELLSRFSFAWKNSPPQAISSLILDGLIPFLPQSLHYLSLELRSKRQAKKYLQKLPNYFNHQLKEQIFDTDKQIRLAKLPDIYAVSPVKYTTLDYLYPPFVVLTMAYPCAIERRHPYSDRRLIEFVLSMPGDLKWEAQQNIVNCASRLHHRQAMKSLLPDSVLIHQPKTEFTPALKNIMSKTMIQQWLQQSSVIHIVERGYISANLLHQYLDNYTTPDRYLIAILALEGWLRLISA